MAKLTILCYDQLHTSVMSNGMAAIPKKVKKTEKNSINFKVGLTQTISKVIYCLVKWQSKFAVSQW